MDGDGFQMPKFFIKKENINGNLINITGENKKHIKNVLRMKKGDIITVNDREGTDYIVELTDFLEDCIISTILRKEESNTEPNVEVILYQGIPKSDKMDYIIQKSVELGVKKIVPVITERTVVRLKDEKDAEKKTARWQKISEEASKQSNRGIIPEIAMPMPFEEALKEMSGKQLKLIPYENENNNSCKSIFTNTHIENAAFIIGPEGGFSENEIKKAIQYGITPITLGPRILRTETAGIALLSIIMYQYGDIG